MRKPELGLTLLIVGMVVLASFALDQVCARQQRFSVGSSWEFQIEGNPSTGYVWRLKEEECENLAIVKVENLGYGAPAADKKKRVGRPAPHRFRITGLSPGFAKLHFEYVQPWVGKLAKSEDLWIRVED